LLAEDEVSRRRRPFASITRKRASAPIDARQIASCNTSAERSEAREDGMGRNATFRVASPLMMATRGSEARVNNVRLARHACSRPKPLPPASQGGSATRNDRRHRRQPLRLRSAPPSATHLSARGFTPRGAGQSEQKRSESRALNYGCPMSRDVNEVNVESHRNRGPSNFNAWKSLTTHLIRSDGCRSRFA
jgi:hypothetical protein